MPLVCISASVASCAVPVYERTSVPLLGDVSDRMFFFAIISVAVGFVWLEDRKRYGQTGIVLLLLGPLIFLLCIRSTNLIVLFSLPCLLGLLIYYVSTRRQGLIQDF